MSEGLKPCPFCGGTDVNLRQHLATNMSWVYCGECGLEAPSETGWTDDIAIEYWNNRNDAAKDAEIARLRKALGQIAEMANWQIGVPSDTEAASEHARIAASMAEVARAACDVGAKDGEIERLRAALEPFALISSEGVAGVSNGYCTVTTQAEYFHAARAALKQEVA